MRKRKLIRVQNLLAAASLSLLASAALAEGAAPQGNGDMQVDGLTKQAVAYLKDGKLQEAQETEDKSIQENPRSWISHATKSYLFWLEGNIPDAVEEGQKAVMFGPRSSTALNNLGHIYLQISDYKDAITFYKEARRSASDDWVSAICLARCYFASGDMDAGFAVLKDMSAATNKTFAWNYQLGVTYLGVDKPELAIAPLEKAVDAATMKEQKSAGLGQLLVALVCNKQLDRAKAIEEKAIYEFSPREGEPYIQSAAVLIPADQAESGKKLLKAASDNLKATKDSETFFKLGRLFETKAGVGNTSDEWLSNAEGAFSKAIELNPGVSGYHLALAAVFERQGKLQGVTQELAQSKMFDSSDQLATFLGERVKVDSASKQAISSKIKAVRLNVDGLTCNCQATRIDGAFRDINGIAVASFSHIKPYDSTIFVDESIISVDKAIKTCRDTVFPASVPLKTPVTFTVKSNELVSSLDELIRIAQEAHYGSPLETVRPFDTITPQLPFAIQSVKTEAASNTVSAEKQLGSAERLPGGIR